VGLSKLTNRWQGSQTTADRSGQSTLPFRVRAINLGLRFSWVVVVVLVIETARLDVMSQQPAWAAILGVAAMLGALSLIRWRNVLDRPIGTVLLWLWAAVILVALAAALSIEELSQAMLTVYLVMIVFVAVIGKTGTVVTVTVAAAGSYAVIPVLAGHTRSFGSLVVPLIALVAIAIIAKSLTNAYSSSVAHGRRQSDELARQETNFERLYEVSRTIASGDRLNNVLPELVGKIGSYLDAEVGVVLMRQENSPTLEVLSPIWAAGHTLEVAGYKIGLRTSDPLAKVYMTSKPTMFESLRSDPDRNGILGELGVDNAMAVPMRVEGQTIGVLVLGDRHTGKFDSGDLLDFVSLAAPASLVLAHIDRYEEAAETSRKMEELARMKTDFVSVVSHELRTPLTGIIGSLATLARPELTPERPAAKELLTSARNQADRLRRLIEDLLMVSRIENQTLPQQPSKIKLFPFLRDMINVVPGAADLVTSKVHEEAETIEADPDQLQRVLINLVQNAIKYARGSKIEIVVAPRRAHQVAIAVIDHGPGISAEKRSAVFDRFTQLEPAATRSQGGTGLGLHIVKGLTQSLGGTVDVTDTPGGGATFVVVIPRSPGAVPPDSIRLL